MYFKWFNQLSRHVAPSLDPPKVQLSLACSQL